jgi:hypothetical protein
MSKTKNVESSPGLRLANDEQQSLVEMTQSGLKAAELLGNTTYNLAHQSVIRNLQDQWLNSEPHETRLREGLFSQAQALALVTNELSAMVVLANELSDEQRDEIARKFG